MAFRRSAVRSATERDHERWVLTHREELASLPIPMEFYATSHNWAWYLDEGGLQCVGGDVHPTAEDLEVADRRRVLTFLERCYGSDEHVPGILNWLRHHSELDASPDKRG